MIIRLYVKRREKREWLRESAIGERESVNNKYRNNKCRIVTDGRERTHTINRRERTIG